MKMNQVEVELLEDTRDITITAGGEISIQGSGTNYKEYISGLLKPGP